MFSKSLFVFFLTTCLIRPNDAIFGIDTAIKGVAVALVKESNNVIQGASSQVLSVLINLQTFVQNVTNNLNTQVVDVVNTVIINGVTAAGGSQTLISNCTQKYQAAVTAFEISALNKIISTCITNQLTQSINIITGISMATNNISDIVVNANSTKAAACPPPSSGDIIGGIGNGICKLLMKKLLVAEVAYYSAIIVINGFQASTVAASLASFTAVIPACVTTQLGNTAIAALPVIAPIVQCSLT